MKKIVICLIVAISLLAIIVSADTQQDFINLLNQERNSLGRNNITIHPLIVIAAESHSQDMFVNNFFSHTSSTGNSSMQRMIAAGFIGTMYGENIAAHTGEEDAQRLFDMWKNSSGHYQNMINPGFNFAGLGIAKGNWAYYNNMTSVIYTLDLGQQNIVCQENQIRNCGFSNIGACKFGNQTCINGVWNSCQGNINPIIEICDNQVDDDCDNQVDEFCNCSQLNYTRCYFNNLYWYDSCNQRQSLFQNCLYGCNSSLNQCNPPICKDYDKDGFKDINCGGDDCNDNNKQINPNSIEVCNNQDENCNTIIDENCIDNLKIIKPQNNSKSNFSSLVFQISTTYLKNYIYYSLDNTRWYVFCSNPGNCSKSIYLSQGINNIYFKASDYFDYLFYSSTTIFVDSVKPRIIKQSPSNSQYANGTFIVTYSEDNPSEIALFLGNTSFIKVLSKNDCQSGSNKLCLFDYNLSEYDGKQIKYYFEVSDSFSSTKSSPYTIKVDLNPPIIQINKFKKEYSSFSYSRYSLNLTLNEISKLEYTSSLSTTKRILCSSCSNTRVFYLTIYNPQPTYLDITATDLAGNKKIERVDI